MNCLKGETKASEVKSETSSKCTALTDNEMNTQMYNFTIVGFVHIHISCIQVPHSPRHRLRTLLGVAPSAVVLASQIDEG